MRIAWLLVLALDCAHKSSSEVPATAVAREQEIGSAGDRESSDQTTGCSTDADCAITRVEAGGCCPMLCTPRVVTRRRADALEANVSACNKGKPCVQPLCRPPKEDLIPACVQGRCVGKTGPSN